ncbi:MAG: hypothetical protein WC233_01580 [Sphaerochaeta sp.]|jgi:hypothetical protein
MKMKHKLLLLASVFFMSFFTGCGIPTIFYVTTSITNITPVPDDTIQFSIAFQDPHNNLDMITPGTGPSLFLGYIVTDQPSLSSTSTLISEFNKKYRRSPNGIHIDSSLQSEPILETSNDLKLFAFSGLSLDISNYHATALQPSLADNTFNITLSSPEVDLYEFKLTNAIGARYTINTTVLTRFNDTRFDLGFDAKDYLISPENPAPRYCHIFAAINVREGLFDNIYWSELRSLGSIELKQ